MSSKTIAAIYIAVCVIFVDGALAPTFWGHAPLDDAPEMLAAIVLCWALFPRGAA